MRAVGGLIAGLLIGFVTAIALTVAGVIMNPFPAGVDPRSPAAQINYYATAPFATLALIVAGRFLGALAGGWAAISISGGSRWPAWAVGVILSLYLLIEMSSMPHPLWMQVTGLLAPLIGAAIAHHFAARPRSAEDEEAEGAEVQHDTVSEL